MPKDSKTRILGSALDEFAAHGYAGARVSRIAAVSRTNKQLIYYYFGSKEGLYQRVLEGVYDEVLEAERSVPKDLEHDLLYWMDFHHEHPYLLRLLEWDGLTYARKSTGGRKPTQMWQASLKRIERNRGVPGWPPGFHGEMCIRDSKAAEFRALDADHVPVHLGLVSVAAFLVGLALSLIHI